MNNQFGITGKLTEEQHQRMLKVYDYFDEPFDSHPDDVAAVYEAIRKFVLTGELPK